MEKTKYYIMNAEFYETANSTCPFIQMDFQCTKYSRINYLEFI